MPLTTKGEEILSAMKREYGAERGERVFNASRNAGVIVGVDSEEAPDCFQVALDTMTEQINSLGNQAAALVRRMDARRGDAGMKVLKRKGKFFLAEEDLSGTANNIGHKFIAGGRPVDPNPRSWFVGEAYNYMRFHDLGQAEKYFEQISRGDADWGKAVSVNNAWSQKDERLAKDMAAQGWTSARVRAFCEKEGWGADRSRKMMEAFSSANAEYARGDVAINQESYDAGYKAGYSNGPRTSPYSVSEAGGAVKSMSWIKGYDQGQRDLKTKGRG